MTDILTREAEESDLPIIEKLMTELIEVLDNTEDINIRQVVNNCKNLLKDETSYFLVAEIEGAVIGFINFTIRQTILHQNLSGLIDELVVDKEFRGKGAGNQLLVAAIRKCRRLGCCEVEVSTEKINTKAREFYKKCGFEERGLLFELDL
ncbi:Acetyltransferase YpeA [uncultured archaeon]|nr:Acetyltransferase YpeA [uncultured archaeon]